MLPQAHFLARSARALIVALRATPYLKVRLGATDLQPALFYNYKRAWLARLRAPTCN